MKDIKDLRKSLERMYETYDFEGRVRHDPIKVPKRYGQKEDAEAAGFIAASFAYGKVSLFLPVIDEILGRIGRSPYAFLKGFNAKKQGRIFEGIRYRFYSAEDIEALIHVMGVLLKKYDSLEAAFLRHQSPEDPDTGAALTGLIDEIMLIDTTPVYGRNMRTPGFKFLFPSPRSGSACKRLNLFLRWMVRRADIDLGLWRGVTPDRLVIPLDTHIARVSRCLGFTRRKSGGWRTAVEITGALKALDPADPLKYDFALCHRGISGVCAGEGCGECELWALGNMR